MIKQVLILSFALFSSLFFSTTPYAEENIVNVIIKTTKGEMTVELYKDKAPVTVENFLSYVDSQFYDGTIFHRVIKDFMIQGGGLTPDFVEKEANSPIKNEADNGLKNDKYTIAMARTMDPHSATCQFFINHTDNDFLNFTAKTEDGWGYCVFGKVTGGMDVVEAIANTKTMTAHGMRDVPRETIEIISIRRK
ncbi:MAG TPA: peptidyl-prolyl cis-trans isomerase [Candidatus Aminicenantes bacterium]|nr:peptidyl-prolyl cis-trans isomerase [Candidatus Aminicenantes bacterium]